MEGYAFCGAPEALESSEIVRDRTLHWFLDPNVSLPGLTRDEIRQTIHDACQAWTAIAKVQDQEVDAQSADLHITMATIDGPYGVLADCQLPGPRVQLLRIDGSERWVKVLGLDLPNGEIDLFRVLAHELGHARGLGHAPKGSPNLMAPTISNTIWLPTGPWDQEQIIGLYGKAEAPVDPGDIDPPGQIWIRGISGRWLAGYAMGKRLA